MEGDDGRHGCVCVLVVSVAMGWFSREITPQLGNERGRRQVFFSTGGLQIHS